MENQPFEDQKDSTLDNIFNISLISDNINNIKPNIINLTVILSIAYHKESFKILVPASTITDETTGESKINLKEIIKYIFSNFDENFKDQHYLSFFINEKEEETVNTENILYNYLGEINLEDDVYQNLIFKVPKDKTVYLKIRQKIMTEKFFIQDLFDECEYNYENSTFKDITLREEEEEEKNEAIGCRQKEKTILYAIIKALIYSKIRKKNDKKISQMDVCKLIRVKKKTLDVYIKQIIKGKETHFDFAKNFQYKMNLLNEHIKKAEKK